jgi:hypothetical protein
MAIPKLVVLRSNYRELLSPIVSFVKDLAARNPEHHIAVVLPRLVERRWRYYLLHNHTASALRAMLVYGGVPQVVVIELPCYLSAVAPERRLLRAARKLRLPLPSQPAGAQKS